MRTTLDLDEDIIIALKELAKRHRQSMGKEASRLIRLALQTKAAESEAAFTGFEPFPAKGRKVVTDDLIDQIRDSEGV
ncbi:MAG: hypothetical protein AXA67_07815 [Methylothermaceae bacteria B42]|nr:MAG: hypothetical protein AXA67_07815 [Methylothermaceae bacteria B42]HHJ37920.1 hypothetical protein [Methylothermaceae bacterium]